MFATLRDRLEYSRNYYYSNIRHRNKMTKRYYYKNRQRSLYVNSQWSKKYQSKRRLYTAHCSRKHRYGITKEYYLMMLKEQNNKCYICRGYDTRKSKYKRYSLSVDHDHMTGKIRKLLCNKCNTAIGLLHDDPKLVKKVYEYIT